MSPVSIWTVIFLAGFGMGGVGAWKVQAWRHDAAILAQQKAADEKEAEWQQDTQTALEVQREELDANHSRELAAVRRVRDEYKRLSQTPRAASDAASAPAIQLYESGAVDLIATAGDADRIAADLRACQAWVESVTR